MKSVLIDDSRIDGHGALLFEQPRTVVVARHAGDVPASLERIEAGVAAGLHAAGWLSYDLGLALEPRLLPLMRAANDLPLLEVGLFPEPSKLSHADVELWLMHGVAVAELCARSDAFQRQPQPLWSETDYLARFDRAKAAIAAGDIYQINLTLEASFTLGVSPRALYQILRARQRVAYGALIESAERSILSLSPELFLEQDGQRVLTRPMKGTAPRAPTPDADDAVRVELAQDAKSRAENLMIVDLMRNDLSRVSEIGSVRVPDLFTVETLSTLHQLTSGVTANLLPHVTFADLIRATFPAGSITGAPKIRAMELIAELEGRSRGVYCGSIGWVAPARGQQSRRARFNVAIRTLTVAPSGDGRIGIGSGVVADSDGRAEYAECLLKMRFLTAPRPPFALFETILLEPDGKYVLLNRHLERLANSARYFGFKFFESAAVWELARFGSWNAEQRLRVRYEVAEDGATTIQSRPIETQIHPYHFIISDVAIDPSDPFYFHKTTRRDVYDAARAALPTGLDEAVFLNDRGEVTEGTITNVFVERGDLLITPPASAGLLPGTLRAELLATGRAVEGTLTREDIETGIVWLGNSVRGLKPAKRWGQTPFPTSPAPVAP